MLTKHVLQWADKAPEGGLRLASCSVFMMPEVYSPPRSGSSVRCWMTVRPPGVSWTRLAIKRGITDKTVLVGVLSSEPSLERILSLIMQSPLDVTIFMVYRRHGLEAETLSC